MHRRILSGFAAVVRQAEVVFGSLGKRLSSPGFADQGRGVVLRASFSAFSGFSAKMHTRGNVVDKEKERFLSMTKEEKRKLYKCGSNYVTLSDVKTWSQHYKELPEKKIKKKGEGKYKANAKLNELVSIWRGDITKLEIDAIVNAANNRLLGGGGVDGAIHSAAGSSLTSECATLNGCQTGNAKMTLGYKLPAAKVIHTVGPMGENAAKLKSCYKKCLQLVQENELKSVAFPCISTGIYGYPNQNAAEIALQTTRDWLEKDDNADKVERVIFCLFLEVDVNIYDELMQEYFPVPEESNPKSSEASKNEDETKESSPEEKCPESEENKGDAAAKNTEDKKEDEKEEKKEEEEIKEEKEEKEEKTETKPEEGEGDKSPQTKL